MESSLESTNNKLLSSEASELKATKGFSAYSLNLLYLFATALAIRLWFNFATEHVNAAAASDASEYLRYATALSKLNWSALAFGPEWKEFIITGPSFPFFLWLCSFATFSAVNSQQLDVYLVAQSIISSLTAVLIAVIGKNVWNQRVGIVAGYLATIYPGFIVNSGRLYSETFATFIEVGALAILTIPSIKQEKKYKYVLLGALLVILQLTRSSMILFSVCSLLLVFAAGAQSKRLPGLNWRAALTNLVMVLTGSLVMLAPWLYFEKTAFDKLSLVIDRVGHYNLFVGTNTNIQGFLSYPYPDGRGIEKKSFGTLVKEAYRQSPNGFIRLMLDKPARLYKFPWNDFRTAIGPCQMASQVAVHQIILLLAILGLGIGLIFTPEQRNIVGKAAVISAFAINLPFLAFITVPRYNLMAMPTLILFAGAAACALISLAQENKHARAPKIVGITALFLFTFLRDDLRAPLSFSAGDACATTFYFVQGTDILVRGLICTVALIALLAALWFCVNLQAKSLKARGFGHFCVAVLAICLLPLSLFPQRANGRLKEGILTLSRPGEQINGKIHLPDSVAADNEERQWFLLVDSNLGQLPKENFEIALNGKKMSSAAMPSIAALDNWHYLKNHNLEKAYLECTYIFDCLSSVANLSNTELRQWFIIPISDEQKTLISKQKTAEITITQKSTEPSSFFTAAEYSKDKCVIPSRAVYSWEKAFYGVENDQGLTCPRYDEIVAKRKSTWSLKYKEIGEDLKDLDLNVRLISVKNQSSQPAPRRQNTSVGHSGTSIPLDKLELKAGELVEISATLSYAANYRADSHFSAELKNTKPNLELKWLNQEGREQTMHLPYLVKPKPRFSISLPLDLREIKGSQFRVTCTYPDNDCQVELAARVINCHPLFSEQELF